VPASGPATVENDDQERPRRRDGTVLDRPRDRGKRCIFIQEAHALIFARLKAAIVGFDDGVFVEAHKLDAEIAKKIPKT